MKPDDLDRWLADDDDEIVPSSGFPQAVMDAVLREASTPPAIPFPWARALPGLISLGVALLAAVAATLLFGVWQYSDAVPLAERVTSASGEFRWIAAAVTLTVASLAWSWRLTRL
jgi:hypothetical protein